MIAVTFREVLSCLSIEKCVARDRELIVGFLMFLVSVCLAAATVTSTTKRVERVPKRDVTDRVAFVRGVKRRLREWCHRALSIP